MSEYVPVPRRRRTGHTDYRARRKAVGSHGILLAVRISGKNVSAQFIKPAVHGDIVLSSSHSRELRRLGWKGSLKSTPACYLLGLMAAKKAQGKGVSDAFLYNGVAPFVRGSRIAAFAKGVSDAGLKLPVSEEVFPREERINGTVIAGYASVLSKEKKNEYTKRFSSLLKLGLKPEDYASHYAEVKQTITGGKR